MAPELGGRRALALSLFALIFTLTPWAVAGLALAVFGLIVGVRDLRTLSKAKAKTAMATWGVVLSSLALLLGGATTAVQVYFSTELTNYAECLKGAGTVTGESACSTKFREDIEKRLGVSWPSDIPLP